jgi:hypothetical protein
MSSPAAESALIVAVPEAEPLVGSWRLRLDRSAPWGVPAHVTLLYPFVAPEEIGAAVLERLRVLFASVEPFAFSLLEARRFDDTVLYLAPVPDAAFRRLTDLLVDAFPDCPPYGGAYDEVIPHLTVAEEAPPGDLAEAEAAMRAGLPLAAVATNATLMVGRQEDQSWSVIARFGFGGQPSR